MSVFAASRINRNDAIFTGWMLSMLVGPPVVFADKVAVRGPRQRFRIFIQVQYSTFWPVRSTLT